MILDSHYTRASRLANQEPDQIVYEPEARVKNRPIPRWRFRLVLFRIQPAKESI
jgi:hypothetical protein